MPDHTIAENLQRLIDAKTAIGSAITAKGGTVGANDGLEEFAADIATIPSGGSIDFSNSPPEFTLLRNIRNLNIVIPNGCIAIGSDAFSGCSGLTSIEIPSSVETIGSKAFSGCSGLTSIEIPSSVETIGSNAFSGCIGLASIEIPSSVETIGSNAFYSNWHLDVRINKPENSISGSPWGTKVENITWAISRFKSSCTETASGESLTGTVNATVGDLVVATFVIRGNTYTIDDDWTLLGISEVVGRLNQRTGMAYKIATSSTESLTVTQDTNARIYINLVSITGASIGRFSGFTTQAIGSSITMNKPQGLVVWGVSSSLWGTTLPYQLWDVSGKGNVMPIQLPNTTQPRCLTALDQSNNATETFRYSPDTTGDAGLAVASLTITGIDNFWYMDSN